MSSNRIQKLLFSEYCDFEDMVLIESPFAQTTREGKGIRQVSLGLTTSKLILAADILPPAEESLFRYLAGVDPEIETFELVAVYPVECFNLSVFHRRRRQSIKAHFCNNKILYFELGGFEKRQMFWNLWCERVKFLSPEDPGSSHSETSVATSTSNSTLYLLATKKVFSSKGIPQIWCKFGTSDSKNNTQRWTDRHLYLGKNLEESPLNYVPSILSPSISQFVDTNRKVLDKSKIKSLKNTDSTINRFARGVPERCTSLLRLQEKLATHQRKNVCNKDIHCYNMVSSEQCRDLGESAVKIWENARLGREERGRHRRRYAFAPQPHFLNGLGPWSVPLGERFSIQIKRAVSLVTIRRPLEQELRLPVSKRQLVASVSCEALHSNKSFPSSTNTIKISLQRPVVFFWTPEYWYRPRSARDAYHELINHLGKVRQYCQTKGNSNIKRPKRKLFKRDKKFKDIISDSEDEDDRSKGKKRKKSCLTNIFNPMHDAHGDCLDRGLLCCLKLKDRTRKPQETYLDYLRRILKMEISLSAWDFDSTTLACQLTLIDRDLFLKIPSIEIGVLICQRSSKNAPNIGAIEAFSHRISCLVATEIIRNDSEKIRARLVARLINTAEKCHKISNFQSCRSILCGLQSPGIYRLRLTWSYVRKRHATKYQVFENLCRLYRDPKLPAYQKAFQKASAERPFLPSLSDIITRLLSKNSLLEIKSSSASPAEAKSEFPIITVSSSAISKKPSSSVHRLLSTLRIFPMNKNEVECLSEQVLNDRNWYDDNKMMRLDQVVEFLEMSQRAASVYELKKNDLARDYLLKSRYREESENFMNSFSIEDQQIFPYKLCK